MQAMMKQMGIQSEEINATKVIIEKTDGTNLIIEEPQITRIAMQGQKSYQIAGIEKEESSEPEISEEDINTVVEKTNCTPDQARKVLESVNGDLAEAILELSS